VRTARSIPGRPDRTHAEGKIVSLFEPTTEIIRKGKAGKPTEFGKMVKLQEAESQIVIAYAVYDQRPSDADCSSPLSSILGCARRLVAADAGFYSAKNEAAAKAKSVKRVCIPNRSTKSPDRKREQKTRRSATARNGAPAARVASASLSDGTDSIAASTRGCRKRWVGLGVIADNLVNISSVMAKQPSR
jgi:transposase, IS5 family